MIQSARSRGEQEVKRFVTDPFSGSRTYVRLALSAASVLVQEEGEEEEEKANQNEMAPHRKTRFFSIHRRPLYTFSHPDFASFAYSSAQYSSAPQQSDDYEYV